MIKGYKAFNTDITNRYGKKFELGKVYHADGKISWGTEGNGFHFCTNLEDCFRYFDSERCVMTEIIGYGKMKKYDDEYYDYYDMYVSEYIKIIKLLTREEIINEMLLVNKNRQNRFFRDFKLTNEEMKLFKECDNYGSNNSQRCKRKQLKKY